MLLLYLPTGDPSENWRMGADARRSRQYLPLAPANNRPYRIYTDYRGFSSPERIF